MWEILERPVPFTLFEMGAGQGDSSRYSGVFVPAISRFFKALEYIIVERSAALRKEQQQWLQKSLICNR